MDDDIADAIVGWCMVPLCLLGLLIAARAHDSEMYLFGFSLAGFTALFGFGLIKRHYDQKDQARARVKAGDHV
jgi:hypothetical protein